MWQVKCVVDTVKAAVPFQRPLRRVKDSLLGYKYNAGKHQQTIRDGLSFLEQIGDVEGKKVLEIGSGWEPLLPILFALKGAKVYMTDLHPVMREATFRSALLGIRENAQEIVQSLRISMDQVQHAARECPDDAMNARLNELGLHYLAPCDCRNLPLQPGSMDIVFSRAVLEHIPRQVIADIFFDSHRVLRAGGLAVHLVDHSDHWSHRDPRISAVNFLKYPDWFFAFTCLNPQNYQNRLRHSEYKEMLQAAGFRVLSEQTTVDARSVSCLRSLRVADKFKRFPPEELATTETTLIATA